MVITWSFPKSWGYPQIIQVNHFSIETYGDLGIPHDLRNPAMIWLENQRNSSPLEAAILSVAEVSLAPWMQWKRHVDDATLVSIKLL